MGEERTEENCPGTFPARQCVCVCRGRMWGDVQPGPLGTAPCQLGVGAGWSWQVLLSQCHCLRCHFLFWLTGEGESHRLPATLSESGTILVQNGPVSIFNFPRGLTRCSVAQHAWRRRTQGSRGGGPRLPGPSNVLGRKETDWNTVQDAHYWEADRSPV